MGVLCRCIKRLVSVQGKVFRDFTMLFSMKNAFIFGNLFHYDQISSTTSNIWSTELNPPKRLFCFFILQ